MTKIDNFSHLPDEIKNSTLTREMVYICICGYSAVTIQHLMGLLLLYNAKNNLPNQRLLAINIAIVEMMCGCNSVISSSALLAGLFKKYWIAAVFFETLLETEIRLTVLHIIFDRFLEIYSNVKYPVYMPSVRMKNLVLALWMVSGILATTNTIIAKSTGFLITGKFFAKSILILDITILVSSVVTYLHFYKTVQKIKRLESITNSQPQASAISLINKKFKLPCYIVLTYLLFNFTSMVIFTATRYNLGHESRTILIAAAHIQRMLGFFSDGFIYVFANKNVRELLGSTFKFRSPRVSGETNTKHIARGTSGFYVNRN